MSDIGSRRKEWVLSNKRRRQDRRRITVRTKTRVSKAVRVDVWLLLGGALRRCGSPGLSGGLFCQEAASELSGF